MYKTHLSLGSVLCHGVGWQPESHYSNQRLSGMDAYEESSLSTSTAPTVAMSVAA
jgi:hypothetical protein